MLGCLRAVRGWGNGIPGGVGAGLAIEDVGIDAVLSLSLAIETVEAPDRSRSLAEGAAVPCEMVLVRLSGAPVEDCMPDPGAGAGAAAIATAGGDGHSHEGYGAAGRAKGASLVLLVAAKVDRKERKGNSS